MTGRACVFWMKQFLPGLRSSPNYRIEFRNAGSIVSTRFAI